MSGAETIASELQENVYKLLVQGEEGGWTPSWNEMDDGVVGGGGLPLFEPQGIPLCSQACPVAADAQGST